MRTIDIRPFPNNATLVNPELAQKFSNDIKNRFLQRTTLRGNTIQPDLLVEGEITDYSITPTTIVSAVEAPGGTAQAAQNKLSITVKIHYENKINSALNFDKSYTDQATFNSDLDIATIEASQVNLVTERIINRIFNDIVAAW